MIILFQRIIIIKWRTTNNSCNKISRIVSNISKFILTLGSLNPLLFSFILLFYQTLESFILNYSYLHLFNLQLPFQELVGNVIYCFYFFTIPATLTLFSFFPLILLLLLPTVLLLFCISAIEISNYLIIADTTVNEFLKSYLLSNSC